MLCFPTQWNTERKPLFTEPLGPWGISALVKTWKWHHTVVCNSLWPCGLKPARRLCPWDSLGKNTGVGCQGMVLITASCTMPRHPSTVLQALCLSNLTPWIYLLKKGNDKECSNYLTIVLISLASKVMLKILQAKLQQYMNHELPDVQARFR